MVSDRVFLSRKSSSDSVDSDFINDKILTHRNFDLMFFSPNSNILRKPRPRDIYKPKPSNKIAAPLQAKPTKPKPNADLGQLLQIKKLNQKQGNHDDHVSDTDEDDGQSLDTISTKVSIKVTMNGKMSSSLEKGHCPSTLNQAKVGKVIPVKNDF